MNIILFSKEQPVLENWQSKLHGINTQHYNNVINCSSFKELSAALADKKHILLYHLPMGNSHEKICYQFVSQYKLQHQMMVFVNSPDASQGLRIFRSGIHGYSNTFLDQKKLLTAIDVIEQGKVWIGAELLKKLLTECDHKTDKNNIAHQQQEATDNGFFGALVKGIKKLFG